METNRRTFNFIGGLTGLVTWLFVGLLPSLVYGGYAGVGLAHALPFLGSIGFRALIAFGMLTGALATAAVFVVFGAVLATGLYVTISSLRRKDSQVIDV